VAKVAGMISVLRRHRSQNHVASTILNMLHWRIATRSERLIGNLHLCHASSKPFLPVNHSAARLESRAAHTISRPAYSSRSASRTIARGTPPSRHQLAPGYPTPSNRALVTSSSKSSEASGRSGRAAVTRQRGADFVIEQVNIGAPRHDEVLVRIVASGVCHTDMVVRDEEYGPLPAVFGHEGAGVVEAVGEHVTNVTVGDHVVLSYAFCGECDLCHSGHPAHCREVFPINFGGGRLDGSTSTTDTQGERVHDHFFGQSSFAEYAVVNRNNLVKVDKNLPLDMLAPLGCGLQTGSGAVINAMKVRPGSSFVAFGAGTVGLASVMAAKVAGATTIIAIDINLQRLELAIELGATHIINSKKIDPVQAIQDITGGGADFTLECTGRPSVLTQAVDSLGFFGTCGIVGAAPLGSKVELDVNGIMIPAKRVMGIVQGDSTSATFIPILIELWKQGRFPFDKLIKHYDFDDINQAVADSESGRVIKPVLRIGKV